MASVRRCDTYALNLDALWTRFNGTPPPAAARKILIAGSGTFAPYPWAVANPGVPVTALDLSERSLRRARWHCWVHGKGNVAFRCGDLTDDAAVDGTFGVIDSYGVLHHLEDPLAGLLALERRLVPGGILRLMVYSRYARREEESIRRAFRLLGIRAPRDARRLLRNATAGSRLGDYVAAPGEAATVSGLADALLHPRVCTYRIDELLEMIAHTGLEPLLFAHGGALEEPPGEINRLRTLEKTRQSPGNFVLYLRRKDGSAAPGRSEGVLVLNPCLVSAVGRFRVGTLRIPPRIGCDNPPLTYRDRSFLRRFATPVRSVTLSGDDAERAAFFKRLLFLTEYTVP